MTVTINFDPLLSTAFCSQVKVFEYWNGKGGNKALLNQFASEFIKADKGSVVEIRCEEAERDIKKDFNTKFFVISEKHVEKNSMYVILEPIVMDL